MNDFYDEKWYDDRWNSMPVVMRKLAADTIRRSIEASDAHHYQETGEVEDSFELIRRKHAEFGHDWIHYLIDSTPEQIAEMNALMPEGTDLEEHGWPATQSAHHGFGTSIRNLLRDERFGAGIQDDDLPDAPYENGDVHRNWDDFYVAAIEAAVGLREV